MPTSRYLPNPKIKPMSASPALAAKFFTTGTITIGLGQGLKNKTLEFKPDIGYHLFQGLLSKLNLSI